MREPNSDKISDIRYFFSRNELSFEVGGSHEYDDALTSFKDILAFNSYSTYSTEQQRNVLEKNIRQ